MLALEEFSLFEDFFRKVVKQDGFVNHPDLVETCILESVEKSPVPFVELLNRTAGEDKGLWKRQFAAAKVLARMDEEEFERIKPSLMEHPYSEFREWLDIKLEDAVRKIITAERGGYELIFVPGGRFMMGSPKDEKGRSNDEGPQREVRIIDFYMGRYPVTNEQYKMYLDANPDVKEPRYWGDSRFNEPRQPVVGVSWKEAQRYAEWAGLILPSEAQWEYACRAGTNTRYYSGDTEKDLDRAGWYRENSGEKTHPVGEKEPNAFGLYDMHGNVWEWCIDEYQQNASVENANTGVMPAKDQGLSRVIRGGSWYSDAGWCRSAFRNRYDPGIRFNYLGFRLVRLKRSAAVHPRDWGPDERK
jgi:formylglycine-generating enzyme required for sulfatase activity